MRRLGGIKKMVKETGKHWGGEIQQERDGRGREG